MPIPDDSTNSSPEELQAQAFAEAQREGWKKGKEEGFTVGREEGFAAGRLEGKESGFSEGMQNAQDAVSFLRNLASELSKWEEEVAEFVERTTIAIALDVAKLVIHREIKKTTAKEFVTHLQKMLQQIPFPEISPTLVLHPDDAALIQSVAPAEWDIEIDKDMERGGVRIRHKPTSASSYFASEGFSLPEWDARIETQWGNVIAKIMGMD